MAASPATPCKTLCPYHAMSDGSHARCRHHSSYARAPRSLYGTVPNPARTGNASLPTGAETEYARWPNRSSVDLQPDPSGLARRSRPSPTRTTSRWLRATTQLEPSRLRIQRPVDLVRRPTRTWPSKADMFVHYLVVGRRQASASARCWHRTCSSYSACRSGSGSPTSCGTKASRPDFVLEILSGSTWRRDTVDKKAIYEAMGVRRVLATSTPVGPFLTPPLIGYRLSPTGSYVRIDALPGTTATYMSDVLGLELRIDDALAFPHPGPGKRLRNAARTENCSTS